MLEALVKIVHFRLNFPSHFRSLYFRRRNQKLHQQNLFLDTVQEFLMRVGHSTKYAYQGQKISKEKGSRWRNSIFFHEIFMEYF